MMHLIAAALAAAAPAPSAPDAHAQHQQQGQAGQQQKMDCCKDMKGDCKDCCKDMARKHEGHGSERGHSAH